MKAAVIGYGVMGRNHARVYDELDYVELVGIADPLLAREGRFYGRADHMLEETRPDIVSICSPTSTHRAMTIEALGFDCHVLVEKPIAANAAEAGEMALQATLMGKMLTVGHIERFNPAVVKLREHLGALGRLFVIQATRLGPFPARISDVGVVVDLAPHDLDLMRLLTRSDPVLAYAATQNRIAVGYEDLFVGVLRFNDGVLGVLNINWLTPVKQRRLEVLGENGMMIVDYISQDLLAVAPNGAISEIPVQKAEPLVAEIAAFLEAVDIGGPPPVPAEDATKALVLAQTMVEAAQYGGLRAL